MAALSPYIHFNGNAGEAFGFYQSIFGGSFAQLLRYREIASETYPIAEADADRIMHISLPVGHDHYLQGSDVLPVMGQVNESDNRNTISILAQSQVEADHLFNGLSQGGQVEMPISDGPLGKYFGMLTDKFGVQWMVTFDQAA